MTITTRSSNYTNQYENLAAKGSALEFSEVDNNWNTLLIRAYDVVPVGAALPYPFSSPPTGWLLANGGTIGSATSGADNEGAVYIALFYKLWEEALLQPTKFSAYESDGTPINLSTTILTKEAAWTANSRITLIDMRERTIMGYKAGSTFAGNRLDTGGAATQDLTHTHEHTLTTASSGSHSHNITATALSGGTHTHGATITVDADGAHTHTILPHDHEVPVTPINVTTEGVTQVVAYTGPTLDTSDESLTTQSSSTHTHTASGAIASDGAHTHTVTGTADAVLGHTHTINGAITDAELEADTLPPYIVMNWIIKYSYGTL